MIMTVYYEQAEQQENTRQASSLCRKFHCQFNQSESTAKRKLSSELRGFFFPRNCGAASVWK